MSAFFYSNINCFLYMTVRWRQFTIINHSENLYCLRMYHHRLVRNAQFFSSSCNTNSDGVESISSLLGCDDDALASVRMHGKSNTLLYRLSFSLVESRYAYVAMGHIYFCHTPTEKFRIAVIIGVIVVVVIRWCSSSRWARQKSGGEIKHISSVVSQLNVYIVKVRLFIFILHSHKTVIVVVTFHQNTIGIQKKSKIESHTQQHDTYIHFYYDHCADHNAWHISRVWWHIYIFAGYFRVQFEQFKSNQINYHLKYNIVIGIINKKKNKNFFFQCIFFPWEIFRKSATSVFNWLELK